MRDHVIAVDVGTGSARAGVVDRSGKLLVRCDEPIALSRPRDDRGEHSSQDIWRACCTVVRAALAQAGISADRIAAIGFDATCSLVLCDESGAPLALREEDGLAYDTLAWLDHRAVQEADECTRTGHPALNHGGQIMSPEMQLPKLMWLKRNRPDLWRRAGHFFDLADFLTFKATGSTERSRCTLSAKWNFQSHRHDGWPRDFLDLIGLDDLLVRGGLPMQTVPVGSPIGTLSPVAAESLGLEPGIAVASGMVDAYAGALGVLGGFAGDPQTLDRQIALIGGTSSCVIGFSTAPHFGRSLWGPYFEAVFAGQWLVETGQSATGGLLNHILRLFAAGGEPTPERHQQVIARIGEMRDEHGADFASAINVLPDFHGNRSPFGDPTLTGAISGLTLDHSFDGLCRIYWRACVSIALGLRQLLETMTEHGFTPGRLHLTGGHVKNTLLIGLYADVTGLDIVVPKVADAVLLGTAINAASAGGLYDSVSEAGIAMAPDGDIRRPSAENHALYARDYQKFLAMQRHRAELNAI
ncbi:MAG: FGGY-family carbohydrate kinase [Allorhizobium sp.]